MKNECGIIKDLLPLYAENIAGPETVEFVEEHLKTCEACREEYERMKEPKTSEPTAVQAETSAAPLFTLKRKMRTKRIQTVAVTALLVIALLVSAFAFLTAPKYIPYSDNPVTVTVDERNRLDISYSKEVEDYDFNYVYETDYSGHIYYFISTYNSLWYKWFKNPKAGTFSLEEEPSKITVYYASNNGTDDVCIYGEPMDPNGGIISLPKIALGFYFKAAAFLFAILLTACIIFRKKENIRIWIERIALYPLSYVIAHLLILGFNFATYSIGRDFPLIIFISLLLWCGMLFAHNVFKTRKEIKEISQALNE